MTKKLLFVTTILLVAAIGLMAADVSGTWKWDQQGRGGNTVTVTLTLKQDGNTLTGTVSQPGRNGNMESPISEGTVNGDEIAFKVTREMGGNSFTISYKGKVSGDSMDLEIVRPGFGGNEAPPPMKVTAKKS